VQLEAAAERRGGGQPVAAAEEAEAAAAAQVEAAAHEAVDGFLDALAAEGPRGAQPRAGAAVTVVVAGPGPLGIRFVAAEGGGVGAVVAAVTPGGQGSRHPGLQPGLRLRALELSPGARLPAMRQPLRQLLVLLRQARRPVVLHFEWALDQQGAQEALEALEDQEDQVHQVDQEEPLLVECPAGCRGGNMIMVAAAGGAEVEVEVPAGILAGQHLEVALADRGGISRLGSPLGVGSSSLLEGEGEDEEGEEDEDDDEEDEDGKDEDEDDVEGMEEMATEEEEEQPDLDFVHQATEAEPRSKVAAAEDAPPHAVGVLEEGLRTAAAENEHLAAELGRLREAPQKGTARTPRRRKAGRVAGAVGGVAGGRVEAMLAWGAATDARKRAAAVAVAAAERQRCMAVHSGALRSIHGGRRAVAAGGKRAGSNVFNRLHPETTPPPPSPLKPKHGAPTRFDRPTATQTGRRGSPPAVEAPSPATTRQSLSRKVEGALADAGRLRAALEASVTGGAPPPAVPAAHAGRVAELEAKIAALEAAASPGGELGRGPACAPEPGSQAASFAADASAAAAGAYPPATLALPVSMASSAPGPADSPVVLARATEHQAAVARAAEADAAVAALEAALAVALEEAPPVGIGSWCGGVRGAGCGGQATARASP
jgi:hypothetical protein